MCGRADYWNGRQKIADVLETANPDECEWASSLAGVLEKPFSSHEAMQVFHRFVRHCVIAAPDTLARAPMIATYDYKADFRAVTSIR